MNEQKLDLQGVKGMGEMMERVEAYAEAHPEKNWIIGRGWDQNLWPMQVYPDNVELDRRFRTDQCSCNAWMATPHW